MEIKLTHGDCIAIPEGCTAEIKDGIITFQQQEPEKEPEQEFKKGDVIVSKFGEILLVDKHSFDNRILRSFVHIKKDRISFCKYPYHCWNERHTWRLATEKERQKLFDAIKEAGLRWNAEEKRVEKVLWRAEKNETYFTICNDLSIFAQKEDYWPADDRNYNLGNYFRTERQAQAAADAIKELLIQIHDENTD